MNILILVCACVIDLTLKYVYYQFFPELRVRLLGESNLQILNILHSSGKNQYIYNIMHTRHSCCKNLHGVRSLSNSKKSWEKVT
jgi:hypothetical protein